MSFLPYISYSSVSKLQSGTMKNPVTLLKTGHIVHSLPVFICSWPKRATKSRVCYCSEQGDTCNISLYTTPWTNLTHTSSLWSQKENLVMSSNKLVDTWQNFFPLQHSFATFAAPAGFRNQTTTPRCILVEVSVEHPPNKGYNWKHQESCTKIICYLMLQVTARGISGHTSSAVGGVTWMSDKSLY